MYDNFSGTFTTDKEEAYQDAFRKLILPSPGSQIKIKINSVLEANTFFSQIQGGTFDNYLRYIVCTYFLPYYNSFLYIKLLIALKGKYY